MQQLYKLFNLQKLHLRIQSSAHAWKKQVAWINLTKRFICAPRNNVIFNKEPS